MVRDRGHRRQSVDAEWITLAERVLREPGGAVAQPLVGVAPLMTGASSAFLSLLVSPTTARGDECSTAWVCAVA